MSIFLFDESELKRRRLFMTAMRRVYLDIPAELHNKWKISACKEGMSMKAFLEKVIEKTFEESGKYWEKHYSIGKLEAFRIDIENKQLVLHLLDFKAHPILCIYFKGYFKSIAGLVVKAEKMFIEETKCMFEDNPYHEFVINWE